MMPPLPPTAPGELPDPQQQAKQPPFPSAADNRALVLVVEDDPQMALMIAAVLETAYGVATASDGQEGLEQALALRPDIILCDVLMPRMNGEQMVLALRARPDFDDVPIVVLSGRTDQQLRIRLLRAGAQDYLVKPFHREELRARIANLLTMRQVRQILQWQVDSQSQDLASLATEVTSRQQELTEAYALLQQREALLQDQASQLERRNRELERLSQERDQAEAAVLRLASIVESSSEAIYSMTLEGVITSWNSSAEKLFGYAAGEVMDHAVSLIIPADRREELAEVLERIEAGEAIEGYETRRVRKDGTPIEVSVTISPLRCTEGRITGASTLAHDITEQKRIAEELAARSSELERTNKKLRQRHAKLTEVNQALEEANRVRSQFLSTMSHELRTPLASIIGFTELLLANAATAGFDQLQQQNLGRILKNGYHLLGLINDVLDLSKMEAGRMNAPFTQVNVQELLTSVVEEARPLAGAQHLVVRVEVEEGIDCLETNSLKLHQILLNLVSNAVKFTETGEVMLSARRVISSDAAGDRIALAVTDSGIGIPAAIQERIFEAFYQADGSYTRKFGGTGLGLAIVKQLTTLLGGTIEVKSAPGLGSTFTVLLPIKAVQPDSPPLSPAQQKEIPTLLPSSGELTPALPQEVLAETTNLEATDGPSSVVLAVDDNPDVIKAALKGTSYRVVGVTEPFHVIESVQEVRPCAITLDVMMPGLNGWQLLYQLKTNPATTSIPVIMLSVLSEPVTGYVLGADDYLIKPFQKNALVNTLDRLVASRQPAFQASQGKARSV